MVKTNEEQQKSISDLFDKENIDFEDFFVCSNLYKIVFKRPRIHRIFDVCLLVEYDENFNSISFYDTQKNKKFTITDFQNNYYWYKFEKL